MVCATEADCAAESIDAREKAWRQLLEQKENLQNVGQGLHCLQYSGSCAASCHWQVQIDRTPACTAQYTREHRHATLCVQPCLPCTPPCNSPAPLTSSFFPSWDSWHTPMHDAHWLPRVRLIHTLRFILLSI